MKIWCSKSFYFITYLPFSLSLLLFNLKCFLSQVLLEHKLNEETQVFLFLVLNEFSTVHLKSNFHINIFM
jgi:hypothetical protein